MARERDEDAPKILSPQEDLEVKIGESILKNFGFDKSILKDLWLDDDKIKSDVDRNFNEFSRGELSVEQLKSNIAPNDRQFALKISSRQKYSNIKKNDVPKLAEKAAEGVIKEDGSIDKIRLQKQYDNVMQNVVSYYPYKGAKEDKRDKVKGYDTLDDHQSIAPRGATRQGSTYILLIPSTIEAIQNAAKNIHRWPTEEESITNEQKPPIEATKEESRKREQNQKPTLFQSTTNLFKNIAKVAGTLSDNTASLQNKPRDIDELISKKFETKKSVNDIVDKHTQATKERSQEKEAAAVPPSRPITVFKKAAQAITQAFRDVRSVEPSKSASANRQDIKEKRQR